VDFELSEQQRMVRDMVREFAAEQLRPGAGARDESGEFPHEIFKELGGLGLLGMLVPEELGGAGMDALSYIFAIEEIARGDASVAVGVSVTNSVCQWPILHFGSDELRRRVLPALARGEELGGIMLTEPEAGSDLSSLRTSYQRDGERYLLSGTKAWITNAGVARRFVVLATRDATLGAKGVSAFVLDAEQPGVHVHPPEKKMGLRSSKTSMVTLEDAVVPAGDLLGVEGQGFKIALATLDHSRIGIAAQSLGIGQAAMDEALRYAKERVQFGKPIGEFQLIQLKLAKMEVARLNIQNLVFRQIEMAANGTGMDLTEASACKLYSAQAAMEVTLEAVQLFGGNGYMAEYQVEQLCRDAKVLQIYAGTDEIQISQIARNLLSA